MYTCPTLSGQTSPVRDSNSFCSRRPYFGPSLSRARRACGTLMNSSSRTTYLVYIPGIDVAPSPSATAALPPRGGRPHRAPSASRAQLLLSEALGRPAQAEEPPTLPPLPHTEADLRALAWDQLKALAVAYPEIEYMPKRSGNSGWSAAGSDSRRPTGTTSAQRSTWPMQHAPSTASPSSGIPETLAI